MVKGRYRSKKTEKVAICLRLGTIEKKIKKVGSFAEVRKMVWSKEGKKVKKTKKVAICLRLGITEKKNQKSWQFV